MEKGTFSDVRCNKCAPPEVETVAERVQRRINQARGVDDRGPRPYHVSTAQQQREEKR